MNSIDNLVKSSNQQTTVLLPGGETADVGMLFHEATERWVMNISYGDRLILGVGVAFHANLLRQWKNTLPFGIACITQDQTDPFRVDDFSSGRAVLYLLTSSDTELVEREVFGSPL